MAGRADAASDQGHKTFFFLRQILKTTGQMPLVCVKAGPPGPPPGSLDENQGICQKTSYARTG